MSFKCSADRVKNAGSYFLRGARRSFRTLGNEEENFVEKMERGETGMKKFELCAVQKARGPE